MYGCRGQRNLHAQSSWATSSPGNISIRARARVCLLAEPSNTHTHTQEKPFSRFYYTIDDNIDNMSRIFTYNIVRCLRVCVCSRPRPPLMFPNRKQARSRSSSGTCHKYRHPSSLALSLSLPPQHTGRCDYRIAGIACACVRAPCTTIRLRTRI